MEFGFPSDAHAQLSETLLPPYSGFQTCVFISTLTSASDPLEKALLLYSFLEISNKISVLFSKGFYKSQKNH